MKRVALILGCIIAGCLAAGRTSSARADTNTATPYPVAVSCTGYDVAGNCQPPFSVVVQTSGVLQASYTTSPSHCTDVTVQFLLDGAVVDTSGYVGPFPPATSTSTGTVDLGSLPAGMHTVSIQAGGTGVGGTCAGTITSWGGMLTVTTSATSGVVSPPTSKEQCKNGGWQTFDNPSFPNQGQCVSFVNHQNGNGDGNDNGNDNGDDNGNGNGNGNGGDPGNGQGNGNGHGHGHGGE